GRGRQRQSRWWRRRRWRRRWQSRGRRRGRRRSPAAVDQSIGLMSRGAARCAPVFLGAHSPAMTDLKRSLRLVDGLAMVVGIMVGSGIFRTPGLVAAQLGRPWLTFVAWVLGGALAFLGALCFAELATRHPRAGGKSVYVREAFGARAGFVVGWVEALGMYTAAIAAIGVAAAEFLVRLTGSGTAAIPWLGAALVALFTGVNLIGVASGR